MNLSHPLEVITASLDGHLLSVLARGDRLWTGRELARAIGASPAGARLALARLVDQGIVRREVASRTHLYSLNGDHLAARHVRALAGLHTELVSRLREDIAGWTIQPVAAFLFGSVARGEADVASDIDVLLVGPDGALDDPGWDDQVASLQARATRWTGNDARMLSLDEAEADPSNSSIVADAMADGILLAGELRRSRSGSGL